MVLESKENRLKWLRYDALRIPDLNIVISGMSGRFPKSNSINELEANLRQGNDMITYNDRSRFRPGLLKIPTNYGRIKDLDRFDSGFFKARTVSDVSNVADIELGHSLEVMYESILDAGINPSELRGSKRVGIYSTFRRFDLRRPYLTDECQLDSLGSMRDSFHKNLAELVAEYFDFSGPVMNFDGACATSGAALTEAIKAIEMGIIDRALVLGSNLPVDPKDVLVFSLFGVLSPTNQNRPFDANTDGYCKSEAIVSLMIERKSLARRCYATVVQAALSSDGFKSEGVTHPSKQSQSELIAKVKNASGIHRNHVQYFELHATGTQIGDPIEVEASIEVYNPANQEISKGEEMRSVGPVIIGSSKSSLGHSEYASGLCSVVKVCLMLENELIYKTLNFEKIHPNATSVVEGRAQVATELTKLEAKIVPVNNFGFGALGAHMVLKANDMVAIEECQDINDQLLQRPRLVLMFGRGKPEIIRFFDKLVDRSNYQTRNCLSNDFLYLLDSINSKPIDRLMNHRGYAIVDFNKRTLVAKQVDECQMEPSDQQGVHYQCTKKRHCAMLFVGYGAHWHHMVSGLRTFAPFWSTIERLHKFMIESNAQLDLIGLLTETNETKFESNHKFEMIIAYSIAQVNMLRDRLMLHQGVQSVKFAGHSVGEVASFYARGIINERQAMMYAYAIEKFMEDNIDDVGGKMVAVMMSMNEAELMLKELFGVDNRSVQVGCINGPMSVTLCGKHDEMDILLSHLELHGHQFKIVHNERAPHNDIIWNSQVKGKLKSTLELLIEDSSDIKCNPSSSQGWLPCVASLPRHQLDQMTIPEYIAECLCRQIDFLNCYDQIEPDSIVVDFGPIGLFESQIKLMSSIDRPLHYVKLMSRSVPEDEQITRTLQGIGKLYTAGSTIDLAKFNAQLYEFEYNQLARRQTPSLSSLFEWDHSKRFALPNYNSIVSSNKFNRIEMNIDDYLEDRKFLLDNKIEGRSLFPVTGYLFFAWKAFSSMVSGKPVFETNMIERLQDDEFEPVEFSNIRFHQSMNLRESLANIGDQDRQMLSFGFDASTGKFEFLDKTNGLICDGFMRSPNNKLSSSMTFKQYKHGCESEVYGRVLSHEDIYRILKVRGYDYGNAFRLIQRNDDHNYSISYANHFICFAENLLQAYITKDWDSANKFKLLAPSHIDYVRIFPDKLKEKLEAFDMTIDDERENISSQVEKNQKQSVNPNHEKTEEVDNSCSFDVYADFKLRMVVTDCMEIRGIEMSPVERNFVEPTLECEMFIANNELPVDDQIIRADKLICQEKLYVEVCDEIAKSIIEGNKISETQRWYEIGNFIETLDESKTYLYMSLKRICMNQLNSKSLFRDISEEIHEKAIILRRLCGPTLDSILENCTTKLGKVTDKTISIAEIGHDKKIFTPEIFEYINTIHDSKLTIAKNYSLFHSNDDVLENLEEDHANNIKFHQLAKLAQVQQTFDLIIYKCRDNLLPNDNDVSTTLRMLKTKVNNGGFVLVILRQQLSLAERLVMAHERLENRDENLDISSVNLTQLSYEIDSIDMNYKNLRNNVEHEMNGSGMSEVSRKTDHFGNLMLIYRNNLQSQAIEDDHISSCLVLRIDHNNIESWVDTIRENFNRPEEARKKAWLCAVVTKDRKVNGLIGMMRTLIKEYGSAYLRCYYDEYTFKDTEEPVSVDDIKLSDLFKLSIANDLLWNCFDSNGTYGSYRHQRINSLVANHNCQTDVQAIQHQPAISNESIGCYIDVSKQGDLSSFKWYESPFKYLSLNERKSLVSVCYSSLNFKDVMLAAGKLKSHLFMDTDREETPLGREYCGYEMATGKRIMGFMAGGGIATHVLATPDRVVQFDIPDWMDMKDAATLPVVYSTVIMGLIVRARMRKGESILIHAGSGGVGQAAINLCRHYGLTIYTTVSSKAKRNFLKRTFPDCIVDSRMFSSRDCNFEHQIMAATKGRGVDLVLNSLADEKLQASIRCLADGGRIIEIGKHDSAMDSKLQLHLLNTNKTHYAIDVEKIFSTDKRSTQFEAQINEMILNFEYLLANRCLRPSKYMIFNRNNFEKAFKYMTQGKHTCKVLIVINEPEMIEQDMVAKLEAELRMQFSREKSYIVTGGLGGMGMELCKWLSSRGVKHLVVTSRNGLTSQYQGTALDSLKRNRDCDTLIVTKCIADTETYEGCESLCKLAVKFAPSRQIGGIFHLSAVLKDGLLGSLSMDDFRQVLKPKLDTAMYLDAALNLLQLEPDYFVCFSSISSGRGNVGQANYSYANSALERICELRRSRGKHGVAIQWGLVGDVGLSHDMDPTRDSTGMRLVHQRIASCLHVLPKLVCSPFAITASCIRGQRDATARTATANISLRSTIQSNIFGMNDDSQVNEQQTLGEHGLESMMMTELMQHIKKFAGLDLTPQDVRALKFSDLDNLVAQKQTC